jgi:hypothetical protein
MRPQPKAKLPFEKIGFTPLDKPISRELCLPTMVGLEGRWLKGSSTEVPSPSNIALTRYPCMEALGG